MITSYKKEESFGKPIINDQEYREYRETSFPSNACLHCVVQIDSSDIDNKASTIVKSQR